MEINIRYQLNNRIMQLMVRRFHDESPVDTTLIFLISIGLIVNSHLEAFYPYAWLAADGLFGNTAFFFCSGFAIASSLQGNKRNFSGYISRRIIRIYPAVILATTFTFALGGFKAIDGFVDYFAVFIWPTPYTYIKLIVPFYFLLWLIQYSRLKLLLYVSGPALLTVAMVESLLSGDLEGPFLSRNISLFTWVTYFWCATLGGAAVAQLRVKATYSVKSISIAGLFFLIYITLKYALIVGGADGYLSVIMLLLNYMAVIALVVSLGDPLLTRKVHCMPYVGGIIALISNVTLEIYVGHSALLTVFDFGRVAFPLNILIFVSLSIVAAIVLRFFADALVFFVEDFKRKTDAGGNAR